MREHITSVCGASHFHLRNIGSIRRYLTPETCATLVHSLISSKLDYCNSLLIELPETQINRFQCIQNSAARIVSRRPRHEHITPVLENLHWLPFNKGLCSKLSYSFLNVSTALHHLISRNWSLLKKTRAVVNYDPMAAYKRRKQTTNSVTEPFLYVVLCSGTGYQSAWKR